MKETIKKKWAALWESQVTWLVLWYLQGIAWRAVLWAFWPQAASFLPIGFGLVGIGFAFDKVLKELKGRPYIGVDQAAPGKRDWSKVVLYSTPVQIDADAAAKTVIALEACKKENTDLLQRLMNIADGEIENPQEYAQRVVNTVFKR